MGNPDPTPKDIDDALELSLLRRQKKILKARKDVIAFAEFMNPHASDKEDVRKSMYDAKKYHRVVGAALEEVNDGNIRRMVINIPPRHGKSELAAKTFIPWWMGQNPGKYVVLATYNEKFAWDFGRKIREILDSPLYRQVFPHAAIKKGNASVERVELNDGTTCICVGRGGTITGRGGDLIIVDDPMKGREEADSKLIREKLWNWYVSDLTSRFMSDKGAIILIQTRWHEDDLVGRLLDPTNDNYQAEEAALWRKIDIPAISDENDLLGREKGEALWPERFGLPYLLSRKRVDERAFQALYQGNPSPDTGNFFDVEGFRTYKSNNDRPANADLRMYCASDHAISLAQGSDKTCLLTAGIDKNDDIYVLPNLYWRKATSDQAVEAMLRIMQEIKPVMWWAEKGHISKSLGPFLRKRMMDEEVYCAIDEITPVADKQSRAQSIRGRIAMGKVYFPEFAPWWGDARAELLKFPLAAHDDFVDALALIGLGLGKQVAKSDGPKHDKLVPGTFGYMLRETKQRETASRALNAKRGW